MPIIKVELFPGKTSDQKRRFAKGVTELYVDICGGSPQVVQILFQEVPKENWATGGMIAADRPNP